jgi:transglutaminase-like putative cysteine protease
MTSIEVPQKHRVLTDKKHGNKALYWTLEPADSGKPIDIRYDVHRVEKAAYRDERTHPADYLAAETMVPNDPKFEEIARQAVQGKKTDLQRARALYDLVIEELRYAKAGDGWGQGNATFACDARHGNCTDYHAYFTALARAIGIPARFAIGAAIPSDRDDGGVDGYHCWVEFHADEKWWPIDISEADKYSALSTYYFGHHPANRIEFSRGRDLAFEPGPQSGPINFFAYPVLEIDGVPTKVPISFTFHRPTSR